MGKRLAQLSVGVGAGEQRQMLVSQMDLGSVDEDVRKISLIV